ncbi:MAG TPA: YCF48-related protein [Terriglobales bacterium]|nr:YCF48-related protein [Terriglobales bacterium]
MWKLLISFFLVALLSGCAVKQNHPSVPQPRQSTPVTRSWTEESIPSKPESITAQGGTFWLCGADEMIASSSDGGASWQLRHHRRGGKTLIKISFVNEKVGHAGGEGGLLFSTSDGGKTWWPHNAGDDVQDFSFADANNGISVLGGDREAPDGLSWGQPVIMDGTVKLTHDGGDHWEEVAALNADQIRPYTHVLCVAALDSSHYLMIRRHPTIEDVFVITQDAGRSWNVIPMQNDATNRVLANWVFVHGAEYWAFGMELVHREKGGGYGVPLTLRSKEGETWTHGVLGPNEYSGCTSQGCAIRDGTVESLYGAREQYWALPQDGSMGSQWAIAGDHACTISASLECGPAMVTDTPQPPRPRNPTIETPVEKPMPQGKVAIPKDCVDCALSTIPWRAQARWVV